MLELQNICYRVSTPEGEQDILKGHLHHHPRPQAGGLHRPQRRRQDHAGQGHHGPGHAHRRPDPLQRRGRHAPVHHRARAGCGISYGFQQPPRFKGITRARPADDRRGRGQAQQGRVLRVPDQGGPVRQRLSGPRGGRRPSPAARSSASRSPRILARSGQTDDLRRAGGRHRPVELRAPDRDLRAAPPARARPP